MDISSDQALDALTQVQEAQRRISVPSVPTGADEIIHQPLRLRVMAVLNSLPSRESIDFTQLRASVQATDGNLGAHLATLERAGYVQIQKDFVGKRPRTRVGITPAGRGAFARHIGYLREVIDLAQGSP